MSTPNLSKSDARVFVKHRSFPHTAPEANIQSLLDIMASLRAPDGCPWDREQSVLSLLPYLLEESAEYIDAAQNADAPGMCEELGDVLLQVVFHAQIAREQGDFTFQDVVDGIVHKLWSRHPHVFGDHAAADSAEDVEDVWAAQKQKEREAQGKIGTPHPLERIPRSLPTLPRSRALGNAASKVGFDWAHAEDVFASVEEELREVRDAVAQQRPTDIEEEIGDLLFSVVNLARKLDVRPDLALGRANRKFERRFDYIVDTMNEDGLEMTPQHRERMEQLWNEARERRVESMDEPS